MVTVSRFLNGGAGRALLGELQAEKYSTPALEHLPGGTPRLTTQTFKALVRRGWVRTVKMRLPEKAVCGLYYWQLSESGKTALMDHLYAKREAEM